MVAMMHPSKGMPVDFMDHALARTDDVDLACRRVCEAVLYLEKPRIHREAMKRFCSKYPNVMSMVLSRFGMSPSPKSWVILDDMTAQLSVPNIRKYGDPALCPVADDRIGTVLGRAAIDNFVDLCFRRNV